MEFFPENLVSMGSPAIDLESSIRYAKIRSILTILFISIEKPAQNRRG